tara:strand:+ start:558 stop:848 length:291 start_codon:yes stop_codon:yes gene_type:complete
MMEYTIPSLVAACGFLFVMWQRSVSDVRKAKAKEETARIREHTSDIMRRAAVLRNAKVIDLDVKRARRKKELDIMAAAITKASGPTEVAAMWNQEK